MTFFTVINKIFKSSRKEQFSTYSKSNSNFSCQVSLFLPFIYANPVKPDLTLCRCFCFSLYKGKYSTNNGLGPIKDISPFKIFHNSGSSSKLVALNNFPNLDNLS